MKLISSVPYCVLFFGLMAIGRAADLPASKPGEQPKVAPPASVSALLTNDTLILGAPTAVPKASAPLASAAPSELDDKLKLGIGDRLSYRIVEDLDEPRPLVVTDSGDVEVPLIGRVPAVDKTCKQLAQRIKTLLEEEYYYRATVILAIDVFSRTRGKVYVVGYVRAPGPLDIPSDELFTLGKAVMRAGGFTDYADKKRVRVTRKGSDAEPLGKVLEVDVGAVLEQGHAEKDLKLEVGDLIYVPNRLFRF